MDADPRNAPITAEALDRLADGSLSDPERRALLSRFDAEPDAWRRCALAFLEAQAWRRAFGPMTAETATEPAFEAKPPSIRTRPRILPIALAACLALVAFLLGRFSGNADGPGGPASPIVVADAPSTAPDRDDPPTPNVPSPLDPIDVSPWLPEVQTVGYLNLPTDPDPEAPILEVPVIFGPGIDDRWLRDQPSFVPEDVRLSWEAQGFEVESQRRLVSVQLDDDGHYLTIPVDEVLLYAIDRPTY
jgi:hypothetical protein